MTLFDLTKHLINISSVTGQEADIGNFLWDHLENQGYVLQEQKIEGSRRNLLAVPKNNKELLIILCTHLDTVPPYIAASEDEKYIYGRGACDAKGSMAAMLWAAKELVSSGIETFGLLFVVGEETDSIGAKTAGELNVSSEFIVVGEPTGNKLAVGHKGVVTLRLTSKGKSAHSAYPKLGESAVDKLLDVLQSIRSLSLGQNPVLGKTSLNIGCIKGGETANIIADSASAEVVIRTAGPAEGVLKKVRKAVKGKVEIEVITQSDPQKMIAVPGIDQVVVPYGTDIPYLKRLGRPLLIGPGSGLEAHTENERVEKHQLHEAVEIYIKLVKDLSLRAGKAV